MSFPILDMSCFIIFKDFLDGGSQDSGILKDERQTSFLQPEGEEAATQVCTWGRVLVSAGPSALANVPWTYRLSPVVWYLAPECGSPVRRLGCV